MTNRSAIQTVCVLVVLAGLVVAPVVGVIGLTADTAAAQEDFNVTDSDSDVVNPDGSVGDTLVLEDPDSNAPASLDGTTVGSVTVNGSQPGIELPVTALTDGEVIRFEVNGVPATITRFGELTNIERDEIELAGQFEPYQIELDVSEEALAGEPLPELAGLDIAGQGADAAVVSGTAGDVAVNITNTGDSDTRSYDVEFTIENATETVNTTTITTSELGPGDSETVTLTDPISGLAADSYNVTVADSNGVDEVTGTLTVEDATASVDFQDQATASPTITSDSQTTPAVVAENVTANVDSTLVVTYENDSETTIAGLASFNASELDGSDRTIALGSGGGLGEHTVHVIPTAELSPNDYAPGQVVSTETEEAALTTATATVFEGSVTFEDQTVTDAATDGDLVVNSALVDGAGNTTEYVVNLHEADANGTPGAFVGSTDVLAGTNTDTPLTLQTPDGDDVTINETGEYVAMIHLVDDGASVGDAALPDEYPVLPNADADTGGFVAGGVTDAGTVSVVTLTFNDQATASSTLTSNTTTDAAVVVEAIDSDVDSAVVVTYENETTGDLVIAGLERRSATELNGSNVTVEIEDTGGFPGSHTAHLIPQTDLSGEYTVGETVSTETAGAIATNEAATVYQGTVEFDEQEYVTNTSTVTVSTTDLAPDDPYVVVVHETTEDGSVGDPIGSSADLTGNQTDVDVPVDEINATDEYVAMLHFASADSDYGAAIPNADATAGFVAGNIADATTVSILTPAEPELADLNVAGQTPNGTIVEGDNETVAVTVTNRGDQEGAFNVTLDIDGQDTITQTSDTLSRNETDTVAFENVTGDLAAGNYSVTVQAGGDELTGDLEVLTPADPALADLDIAGQGASAEIVEGDNAPVAVNVTNDGQEVDAFNVTLDIEGETNVTRTSAELGLDETDTVTFDDVTGTLAPAEYNVSVTTETGDANVSGDLTVLTAAESELSALDIAGQNDTAEIVAGDDEAITANVTNVGEEPGAVSVNLLVDDEVVNTIRVTDLAGNATEPVRFENATGDLAAGEYDVAVQTADDSVSGTLDVITPAESELTNVDIAGQGANATLLEGDNESVTVDVTNRGEEVSNFTVTLEIDGQPSVSNTTAALGLDETDTVTFENVTGDLAAGDANVTVRTADDEVTGSVSVFTPVADGETELSDLEIAEQGATATIVEGDDEPISANVTNNGPAGGVAVELTVANGETVVDEQIVEVGSETTTTVPFESVTGDLAAGDYDVTVSTADDNVTGTLTVQTPADPALSSLDIAGEGDTATIVENDSEAVAVDVTNTGEEVSDFTVTLDVDGTTRTETTDALGFDETDTVTFEDVTGDLAAGAYDVEASTGGASVTGSLTVQTPAESELSNLDIAGQGATAEIEEGDDESVAVDVQNVGEATGTFTVTLTREESELSLNESVTLAGNASETVTFEDVTGSFAPGNYDVTVSTADDTITGALAVDDVSSGGGGGGGGGGGLTTGPAFEITSLEPGDVTIEQGESVNVTVTVENVNGFEPSTPLELRLDGVVVAEDDVPSSTQGDTVTLTFSNLDTSDLGPGEYTYGAYIDDTEQTATITVDGADDGGDGGADGADDGTDGTDGDDGADDGADGTDGTDGDDGGDGGADGDDGTDGDGATDDSTPGFSVLVTLVAVLLATGLLTRRN